MDDNDKKVASPASSNTAQLWTEKYRQNLGYFVVNQNLVKDVERWFKFKRNDQMTALLIAGSTRIVTNTRDNVIELNVTRNKKIWALTTKKYAS
ncbi:hypothetical protein RhiirA5_416126 [Rhizophagus irregularis]|uniref:Uncharacterized protein n=1 Tax=Rhizophagus irregularis TaxID=588596 RepID=A0A2N0PQI3_9GLOM|nr:hypothetical protein RhiirA5_416126 [Rhizophagus irregularis]